jgi:hypothetical protein
VGKMRYSLKTLKRIYGFEIGRTVRSIIVDMWPQARTYGLKYDRGLYFNQPSEISYFLILGIVLSKVRTNRRFGILINVI